MTTSIVIKPHAVEPNNGVEVSVIGEGSADTHLVKNGNNLEIAIHGSQRLIVNETRIAPAEEDGTATDQARDGDVTARSFNPSKNPTVDGVKTLVEHTAGFIKDAVPACRRRSIALTHLETASMYAVKANFYPEND